MVFMVTGRFVLVPSWFLVFKVPGWFYDSRWVFMTFHGSGSRFCFWFQVDFSWLEVGFHGYRSEIMAFHGSRWGFHG